MSNAANMMMLMGWPNQFNPYVFQSPIIAPPQGSPLPPDSSSHTHTQTPATLPNLEKQLQDTLITPQPETETKCAPTANTDTHDNDRRKSMTKSRTETIGTLFSTAQVSEARYAICLMLY